MPRRRRVAFSHSAIRDLKTIGIQSERMWGRAQMRRYLRDIHRVAAQLSKFPERHALLPTRTPNIRKARSGAHLLLFQVTDDTVEIIRILHERRDPTLELP